MEDIMFGKNVKLNELSEHIDGYSSFVIENA